MREEHPGELEYIERAAASAARMNQSAMMRGEISKKSNGRERVISGNEPMDISLAKENRTGDPNP